ncbi:hypothetical protein CCP3SC5AM1_1520008 [Gammaproteobacteria bacterium]
MIETIDTVMTENTDKPVFPANASAELEVKDAVAIYNMTADEFVLVKKQLTDILEKQNRLIALLTPIQEKSACPTPEVKTYVQPELAIKVEEQVAKVEKKTRIPANDEALRNTALSLVGNDAFYTYFCNGIDEFNIKTITNSAGHNTPRVVIRKDTLDTILHMYARRQSVCGEFLSQKLGEKENTVFLRMSRLCNTTVAGTPILRVTNKINSRLSKDSNKQRYWFLMTLKFREKLTELLTNWK